MAVKIWMENKVFLDTSFAIALSVESDAHHKTAIKLSEQLESEQTNLITTTAILLEIGNALSKKRYRQAAVLLLDSLEQDQTVEIIAIDDELYRQADAFIFPSFREPTGIVLFEAMAAGLPLVVADYGGPSGIADDETGFRVAPTSPSEFAEGLARAVRKLALDPSLRASMSQAAVRRSAQLGSWEAKFARVAQLYNDIAGISPQP